MVTASGHCCSGCKKDTYYCFRIITPGGHDSPLSNVIPPSESPDFSSRNDGLLFFNI